MLLLKRSRILVTKYCKNTLEVFQFRWTSTDQMKWKSTVGLEIHAQIAAKSKLFSVASTDFNSKINSSVSLFDSAVPGTMPVLNKKCVEAGVFTALALSCEVHATSMFERKHYFYSDLPAGFQITQQQKPLASNGELTFIVYTPGVHKKPYLRSSKIKQLQLEQDSGRSLYDDNLGRSLIDLNRAGVPLMELVFEPDLTDGEEAAALVKELCLLLQIIGTCSCKMEEGALRVDANISVSKHNEPLGTRTEIKNIGSTRAVCNAVNYEIKRQISILEAGGQIVNETRGWDTQLKKTTPMREKEERHDYRFMPEPNLPLLQLHVNEDAENKYNLIDVPSFKEKFPELPEQIRQSLIQDCVQLDMVDAIMSNLELLYLFRDILKKDKNRKSNLVAHFFINEMLSFLVHHKLELKFCIDNQDYIEEMIDLLQGKEINYIVLKMVFNKMVDVPRKMPRQIVEENNWFLISDEQELEKLCLRVIESNPKTVRRCKSGKKRTFSKLLHEVTLITQCADMSQVSKIMTKLLS